MYNISGLFLCTLKPFDPVQYKGEKMTSQKLKEKVVFLVSTFHQIFFVDMKLVWKCHLMTLWSDLFFLEPDRVRYIKIANRALFRMKRRANRRIKIRLAKKAH